MKTRRIDNCVIRGEVDNRIRGRVTGKIWLNGLADPLVLNLQGDPLRDVAGHVVRFVRKVSPPETCGELHTRQDGETGVITAARKKKVPVQRGRELERFVRERMEFHWKHEAVFQLEWFSELDGHILLESADMTVTMDGEPEWTMSPEEENRLRQRIDDRFRQHNERLLLETPLPPDPEPEEIDVPEEEKIADREDARMELLNDRIQARLEKEEDIDSDIYDHIYREEREKLRIEWGEPDPEPLTPEQEEERDRWIEELNAAASDALDEMRDEDWEEPEPHPLVQQCFELGLKIEVDMREGGWEPREYFREHPLMELCSGVEIASAKLAGGLDTLEGEWPPPDHAVGNLLVRLKKARGHLNDALRGLEAADEQNLAVPDWRHAVGIETREILAEVERLIQDVRDRLR